MENSKTKTDFENKETEIKIEPGDYFIPLERLATRDGVVKTGIVYEINSVKKEEDSFFTMIEFYNFDNLCNDIFAVDTNLLILNTEVDRIQYDFTYNSKVLYLIRKKVDRKSSSHSIIPSSGNERLVPEFANDSINNQKTDFNDAIKESCENVNIDENYYGSYKKRQLLNVATQIYCSYLKTLPVVKNHNLIDMSIQDAKLLIEKCNE